MTYEQGDPTYAIRDDLLAFLSHGSPKLRELFSPTYQTCYIEGDKLMVVEDVPLCAKLYEDSLRDGHTLHPKVTLTNLLLIFGFWGCYSSD